MAQVNAEYTLEMELRSAGLIKSSQPRFRPLSGGVSSEIVLVEDGAERFVIKRALAKLRVSDEWFADVGRNRTEQEFFAYAGPILPAHIPRIIYRQAGHAWFAMEYLGPPFHPWKDDLMAGKASGAAAKLMAGALGRLHARSWGDPRASEGFSTLENFRALRIDAYLLSAARRVPELSEQLVDEANGLAQSACALVHGDYSPKNLLISEGKGAGERFMILDAEAAWFGDPAFDIAFFLTHLHLKALYHASRQPPAGRVEMFLKLSGEATRGYFAALGGYASPDFERRVVRLLLCILLARVHGKSPVEYLTDRSRAFVTNFVRRFLPSPPSALAELLGDWGGEIGKSFP